MTKKQLQNIVNAMRNLPRIKIEVREVITTEDDRYGEHAYNMGTGEHSITLKKELLDDDRNSLCILAHEAMHAVLAEIFYVLVVNGTLSPDLVEMLTERAANGCSAITMAIYDNEVES